MSQSTLDTSPLDVAAVDKTVADNLSWNFTVNLLDIVFISLGLSLISRDTVMPVLIQSLTDSKVAVGLIAALFAVGMNLPQLFSANFTERLRYKKPFVMTLGGLGERVPYLILALVIWRLAVPAPTLTLTIFFLLLLTAAASAGTATPAWFDMIAKVIPVQRRGLWSGLGHGLGALMGIAGAALVARILEGYVYPNNFAILFAFAFIFVAISWVGLALTREPPSIIVKESLSFQQYMNRLPTILRNNSNYRRFLLSRTTVQFGAMASSFFMVYGTDRFVMEGSWVGLLTGVLIGSKAVMNLVWGIIGDRIGHKTVLAGAAFALVLAVLVAWSAASPAWLVVTFFLLGAYFAGDEVSALNIILEFCTANERPTYIGLTNTLLAPVLFFAPIVGGLLADAVGYRPMFMIALLIATLGGLLLTLWVCEPRRA